MIPTFAIASLRHFQPLLVRAQFRVACRCLVALGSPAHARYASHKSSKAMKAMKSIKKAELAKPFVPKPTVPKAKTTPAAKAQEPVITPESYILLEQHLGSKSGPTLLYHKSHWKLVLGCYALTASGIWIGLNHYYVSIMSPVGVPGWVTWTHYVGVLFIGIGVVATFMYPARSGCFLRYH